MGSSQPPKMRPRGLHKLFITLKIGGKQQDPLQNGVISSSHNEGASPQPLRIGGESPQPPQMSNIFPKAVYNAPELLRNYGY